MNEPNILQVVLMGLITVFVVLVCLIGIIKLLGLIMSKVAGRKNSAEATAVGVIGGAAAPVPAAPQPQQNNRQLVAAIAAAIAEEMGETVDHIRIHSIRRL